MKKGSKRTIAVISAAIMCLSSASAMAAGNENAKAATGETVIMPRYIAITSTANELDISGSSANCYGYTSVQSGYKAYVKVELQRKNGTWGTIKTWYATGGMTAAVDQDYTISTSYDHRLKVTHKSLDANGNEIESFTSYSAVK